jgi:triosephosphate isomerase
LTGHHLNDLGAHAGHVGAEVVEDLGRDTVALAHQPEQHVLGTDVGVPQLKGLPQ